jgi:uncharacterized iron-regulated protein
MKKLIVLCLLFTSCARVSFYDAKNESALDLDQFIKNIPESAIVVLGEEHYNKNVQKAQAQVLQRTVELKEADGKFIFAWEFLNRVDQEKVETAFADYQGNRLFDIDFMKIIMGEKSAKNSLVYMPLFKATKDLGGDVLALNAPREWKRTITSSGLKELKTKNPEQYPKNYNNCSANYLKRFKEAMSGHPLPDNTLEKYYEAQCYTDNYMAETLATADQSKLTFVVVGKYHSDYFDGVVRDLKLRMPKREVVTLSFTDIKKANTEEIEKLKKANKDYGVIADVLVLIN